MKWKDKEWSTETQYWHSNILKQIYCSTRDGSSPPKGANLLCALKSYKNLNLWRSSDAYRNSKFLSIVGCFCSISRGTAICCTKNGYINYWRTISTSAHAPSGFCRTRQSIHQMIIEFIVPGAQVLNSTRGVWMMRWVHQKTGHIFFWWTHFFYENLFCWSHFLTTRQRKRSNNLIGNYRRKGSL